MDDEEVDGQRLELLRLTRQLADTGLQKRCEGNASILLDAKHAVMTPSKVPARDLEVSKIPLVHLGGDIGKEPVCSRSAHKLSTEWRAHRLIYDAFPEARCVIHCHSPNIVRVACLKRKKGEVLTIPVSMYYMVQQFGGDIRWTKRFEQPASLAFAQSVLEALDGRTACIATHHGGFVYGRSPEEAFDRIEALEEYAGIYLDLGNRRGAIPRRECAKLPRLFESYFGQKDK